jgi:hypothetical protein
VRRVAGPYQQVGSRQARTIPVTASQPGPEAALLDRYIENRNRNTFLQCAKQSLTLGIMTGFAIEKSPDNSRHGIY